MTDEDYIPAEIDWSDERFTGLECWFINTETGHEILDEIKGYETDYIEGASRDRKDDYPSYFIGSDDKKWPTCRLALGDRQAYDGKRQPVPDGIRVNVWLLHSNEPERVFSEVAQWGLVTHYQVIEQETYSATTGMEELPILYTLKTVGGAEEAVEGAFLPAVALEGLRCVLSQAHINAGILRGQHPGADEQAESARHDYGAQIKDIERLQKHLFR